MFNRWFEHSTIQKLKKTRMEKKERGNSKISKNSKIQISRHSDLSALDDSKNKRSKNSNIQRFKISKFKYSKIRMCLTDDLNIQRFKNSRIKYLGIVISQRSMTQKIKDPKIQISDHLNKPSTIRTQTVQRSINWMIQRARDQPYVKKEREQKYHPSVRG